MTSQKETKLINDIPSQIKHWADTSPDKETFVFFNDCGRTVVLTAQDVFVLAGRFATRLRTMGFRPGDVISNALPNCPERVVTDFGVIMAGCIVSNCQIMETDGTDFWDTANCCKTVGIILPGNKNNSAYTVLQKYLPSNLQPSSDTKIDVSMPEVPSMKRVLLVNRSSGNSNETQHSLFLDGLRHSSEEVFLQQDGVSPDSIVYVFGTSGTTGYSKLSPRDHATILATARAFGNSPPSVRISQRPLGWAGGYPFSYLANATCYLIQDCFEGKTELGAQYLWDTMEREGCTSCFMLPQEMEPFLQHFKDNPPKHRLKAIITGGQPLTKRVCDALGVLTDSLILSYASTEMTGVTNGFLTSADQMEDFMTGTPLPGVEVKIVDEDMKEVGAGKEGIVVIKSPFGSDYYYNQSPKKQTCTDDGYFISGDRGWLNKDGVLFVSDRQDDVIFHGSILVYPSWPERILNSISGVSEAVVMGVPGPDSRGVNDQLCACVVVDRGSALDKDSLISSYNASFVATGDEFFPKISYVEFFSEFPKGHTGKANKRLLREMVMGRIGR